MVWDQLKIMQKNIQSYYRKVDDMVNRRVNTTTKGRGAGLLASSKIPTPSGDEPKEMKLIADIVQGIREARQEIMNGSR